MGSIAGCVPLGDDTALSDDEDGRRSRRGAIGLAKGAIEHRGEFVAGLARRCRTAVTRRPGLRIEVRRLARETRQNLHGRLARADRQLGAAEIRAPGRDPRRHARIEFHGDQAAVAVDPRLESVEQWVVLGVGPVEFVRLDLLDRAARIEDAAAEKRSLVPCGDRTVVGAGRLVRSDRAESRCHHKSSQ